MHQMKTVRPDDNALESIDLNEQISAALYQPNGDAPNTLMGSVTISEALRELFGFPPVEQDKLMSLMPVELALRLIDAAPLEPADDLIERQEA